MEEFVIILGTGESITIKSANQNAAEKKAHKIAADKKTICISVKSL